VPYLILANIILVMHSLVVAFVIFGFVFIVIGKVRKWGWSRKFWFRLVHLLAMSIVTLQSWVGVICPLTIWENKLRSLAGEEAYEGSFVQYWLRELIFFDAAPWVFVSAYTVFVALIIIYWFIYPPQKRNR
jgi:hypothetical protein